MLWSCPFGSVACKTKTNGFRTSLKSRGRFFVQKGSKVMEMDEKKVTLKQAASMAGLTTSPKSLTAITSPSNLRSDTSSASSAASSFWSGQKVVSSTPKVTRGSSRPKKDLQECVASELQGLLPLQLGEKVNPQAKEGFIYTLDAPTSGMVRRGEDPLTYLNKDMFYGLTLEYTASQVKPGVPHATVNSIILLQFREKKLPQDAKNSWEFWQSRQHSPKLRLLDVDIKGCAGVVDDPKEIAHNAIVVTWNPSQKSAYVPITVRCLSTDFSSQKGVKGIPLHIQVDTYENNQVCDRAFCQIKTFCDKGAERKAREEERRMSKQFENNASGLNYIIQVQPRSVFQRAFDLVTEPVLYTPSVLEFLPHTPKEEVSDTCDNESGDQVNVENEALKIENALLGQNRNLCNNERKKSEVSAFPNISAFLSNRVLIYVKQDSEEIYTPLHIVPPTVQGLIRAISSKYQIESVDIRFVFRETQKGIIVKIDDDMIKYYSNGDVFAMKVMATEDTNNGHLFYDVVFTETETSPHFNNNHVRGLERKKSPIPVESEKSTSTN